MQMVKDTGSIPCPKGSSINQQCQCPLGEQEVIQGGGAPKKSHDKPKW